MSELLERLERCWKEPPEPRCHEPLEWWWADVSPAAAAAAAVTVGGVSLTPLTGGDVRRLPEAKCSMLLCCCGMS